MFWWGRGWSFQKWKSSIPGLLPTVDWRASYCLYSPCWSPLFCCSFPEPWPVSPLELSVCSRKGLRRPDTQHSFPETLDKQLTNTLIRILHASWLQCEERVFLEPHKARLRKLLFFLSSINLTWENIWIGMARLTNKINYYSYERSWWFGISFWAHV